MSKLHECARRIGVETHIPYAHDDDGIPYGNVPRPDLEIAHELLAKLPPRKSEAGEWGLYAVDGATLYSYWDRPKKDRIGTGGSFIEAVIALCAKSQEGESDE